MTLPAFDFLLFVFSSVLCHALILFLQRYAFSPSKWSSEREFEGLGSPGKEGTPIYGGIAIVSAALAAGSIILAVHPSTFSLIVFYAGLNAGIGFLDDWSKLRGQGTERGLSQGQKYILQFSAAILFWLAYAYFSAPQPMKDPGFLDFWRHTFSIPFTGRTLAGAIFLVFLTNCANILDGMDGLAAGPVIQLALFLSIAAFLAGSESLARTFHLTHSVAARSLHAFLLATAGATMAFLWHNAFPARLYMGDSGSLFLGSTLAGAAVFIGAEWCYAVAATVLILEGLSSLLQSYLGVVVLGRRIIFRSPLHHNMYFKGTAEPKVVVRIWLISLAFTLLAALLLISPALHF